MSLESFEKLWWMALGPTVWCEKYQHPLHRLCPVVLNYENLPEPFKTGQPHEGKTGDTVRLTPAACYSSPLMIQQGGICDPV
jgi:hypothetical protein